MVPCCYEYGSTKYGSVMDTWYRFGMAKSTCLALSMYTYSWCAWL